MQFSLRCKPLLSNSYCQMLFSLQLEEEETVVSIDLHTEKLNKVSKDDGRTQKSDFSESHQKHRFWANLVQKIKIISLS